MTIIKKTMTLAMAVATAALTANAGTVATGRSKGPITTTDVSADKSSALDKLWSLATLYKSDTGVLNELSLTGRYQGQYYDVDGSKDDSDWEHRRARVGLKAMLFEKALEVKAETFYDLKDEGYLGFTELYLALDVAKGHKLTVGKQKPKFGYQWTTSSRLISTFERGILTNSYKPEYTAGVSLAGDLADGLAYYVGAFANDATEEFADFEGGMSYTATLTQKVSDTTSVSAGYLFSDREEDDSIFSTLDHGVDLTVRYKNGPLGLVASGLYLAGGGDRYGLSLMPTYMITDKLQFVARYQIAAGDEDAIKAQKRYESKGGLGKGDSYQAIYAGFNYFIHEDKLKLMLGAEYADLDDDSLTLLGGVRLYF